LQQTNKDNANTNHATTNSNNTLETLLTLLGTFHTLTAPILIGFFSLLQSKSGHTITSSQPFGISAFLGIGLLLYFGTFVILFYSHDKNGVISYERLHFAFWTSLVTSVIFVLLILFS
jgi:hypothetical protein